MAINGPVHPPETVVRIRPVTLFLVRRAWCSLYHAKPCRRTQCCEDALIAVQLRAEGFNA